MKVWGQGLLAIMRMFSVVPGCWLPTQTTGWGQPGWWRKPREAAFCGIVGLNSCCFSSAQSTTRSNKIGNICKPTSMKQRCNQMHQGCVVIDRRTVLIYTRTHTGQTVLFQEVDPLEGNTHPLLLVTIWNGNGISLSNLMNVVPLALQEVILHSVQLWERKNPCGWE